MHAEERGQKKDHRALQALGGLLDLITYVAVDFADERGQAVGNGHNEYGHKVEHGLVVAEQEDDIHSHREKERAVRFPGHIADGLEQRSFFAPGR